MFRPNPKPIKWVDKKYQKFVKSKGCVFCWHLLGVHSKATDFCHLRQFVLTGTGTKPSDSFGVGGCKDHHDLDHKKPCRDKWLLVKCLEFMTEYVCLLKEKHGGG